MLVCIVERGEWHAVVGADRKLGPLTTFGFPTTDSKNIKTGL